MTTPLDLDQLQSFCAIADCGSFTEAARRVHKTQSAVSMQIKKLEDTLGRAVFARDGQPISGAEKTVAMNYLKKTEREVARELRGLEVNDDRFVAQIGRTVRDRNGYPFSL